MLVDAVQPGPLLYPSPHLPVDGRDVMWLLTNFCQFLCVGGACAALTECAWGAKEVEGQQCSAVQRRFETERQLRLAEFHYERYPTE